MNHTLADANVGGTDLRSWAASPTLEYDSWLTVGITDAMDPCKSSECRTGTGRVSDVLNSTGIDFEGWSIDRAMRVPFGSVFWRNPDAATPGEVSESGGGREVVVAQLTVPTGSEFVAVINARGRPLDPADRDWEERFEFSNPPAPPPPPPPPSRDTSGEVYQIAWANGRSECGQSHVQAAFVGFAITFNSDLNRGTCAEHGFTEFVLVRTAAAGQLGTVDVAVYTRPAGGTVPEPEPAPAPVAPAPAADPCAVGPCLNGATCSLGQVGRGHPVGAFTCLCATGWAGELCAETEDVWSSQPGLRGALDAWIAAEHMAAAMRSDNVTNTTDHHDEFVAVHSSITFNADIDIIGQGTQHGRHFEIGFQEAMALALDSTGELVQAEDVQIETISSGSIVVSFGVWAPVGAADAAVFMIETLQQSKTEVVVTIGDSELGDEVILTAHADTLASPAVMTGAAMPMAHHSGGNAPVWTDYVEGDGLPVHLFFVVLGSACLHASWNFVIRSTKGDMGVVLGGYLITVVILGLMCAALYDDIIREMNLGESFWYIVATGVIHAVYLVAVALAYSKGAISVVYPMARGTAVALTATLSVPLLGATLSAGAVFGVGCVVVGVLIVGLQKQCCGGGSGAGTTSGETRGMLGLTFH